MMKKALSILLAVVMVISIAPISTFAADDITSYLTYEINDGEVTITDCDSSISGDVVIPDTIEGYPVTAIDDWAFDGCFSLTSVTIGNCVTSIGDRAFYECESLTCIEIPDSVTSIGEYAFYYCISLASIEIPDSVTTVGSQAFYGTAYYEDDANWKNRVLYIGNHLVKSTDICEIKEGTLTIADNALLGYKGQTSIEIPESVTSIGEYALGYQYNDNWEYELIEGFVIYGVPGSVAETYANENGIAFLEPCKHETTVVKNAVDATCTSGGYTGDIHCEKCDELLEYGKYVPELGHTEEIIPGKEATCKEEGLTEGLKCSVCGEIILEQTATPTLAHYFETIPGKAPTCTETGLTSYGKCIRCGEVSDEQTVIPVINHIAMPTTGGTMPECEDITVTESDMCMNCGEKFNEHTVVIPGIGHTEEIIPEVPATYTATGLTAGKKCSVCDEILVAQEVIPMLEMPSLTPSTENITVTDTVAKLTPEMSVEDIIKSVENENVQILNKDGEAIATDALVGTGSKVQVLDNDGKVLSEYVVMVKSDVDGNGKITPADARLALRASAKLDKVEGVFETAANYDDKDTVSTSDARMILRKSAGLEK